jgi:hypothetical protein
MFTSGSCPGSSTKSHLNLSREPAHEPNIKPVQIPQSDLAPAVGFSYGSSSRKPKKISRLTVIWFVDRLFLEKISSKRLHKPSH